MCAKSLDKRLKSRQRPREADLRRLIQTAKAVFVGLLLRLESPDRTLHAPWKDNGHGRTVKQIQFGTLPITFQLLGAESGKLIQPPFVEGFWEWNRTQESRKLVDKIMSSIEYQTMIFLRDNAPCVTSGQGYLWRRFKTDLTYEPFASTKLCLNEGLDV